MILGYLWLNSFSDRQYDHEPAALSAAASALRSFCLPLSTPIHQMREMTPKSFDRLLMCIFMVSTATIAVGASYNFRPVTLDRMYEYRAKLDVPLIINFIITMVSSSPLPFAFAGFADRKALWRAVAVLILLRIIP